MKLITTLAIIATLGIFTPANANEVEQLEAKIANLLSELTSHGGEYDNYTAEMKHSLNEYIRLGDKAKPLADELDNRSAEMDSIQAELQPINAEIRRLVDEGYRLADEVARRHLTGVNLQQYNNHRAEADFHKAQHKHFLAEANRFGEAGRPDEALRYIAESRIHIEEEEKHNQQSRRYLLDIDIDKATTLQMISLANQVELLNAEASPLTAELTRHSIENQRIVAAVKQNNNEKMSILAEILINAKKRDYQFKESSRLIEEILILEEQITEAQTIEH